MLVPTYTLNDNKDTAQEDCVPSMRPHISEDELDALDIVIHPHQRSIKETVLRSLQIYVDRNKEECIDLEAHGDHQPTSKLSVLITQEHVAALEQLTINERQSHKDADKTLADQAWRPLWADVIAVYLIEKIIVRIIQNNLQQKVGSSSFAPLIVRLTPPSIVFDAYKYYALLCVARTKNELKIPTPMKQSNSARKAKKRLSQQTKSSVLNNNDFGAEYHDEVESLDEKVVERPELPVDEFEDVIVKSVYRNRVTIIQGETGCGTCCPNEIKSKLLNLETVHLIAALRECFLSN
jgi:hypothetical protein